MKTHCSRKQLRFQGCGKRKVVADFSGGQISSDGGVLLLGEVAKRSGILKEFAACFTDDREAARVEHSVGDLVAQRVLALAQGYEDLNDHDTLRNDPALAVAVGKQDVSGNERKRERDRGHALASKSTLNRLERSMSGVSSNKRYHRFAIDEKKVDALFVDVFLRAMANDPPAEIVLDIDATDDPLHGKQEGRFFHGHYGCYCYLPLCIFCNGFLLCARLRPANGDGTAGCVDEIRRLVSAIRACYPKMRIVVRGDSGFAREELMCWCEANRVSYVLGLAKNDRLKRLIAEELEQVKQIAETTEEAARLYVDLRYTTLKSWSCERRVVAKAEQLPKKSNPRFVVTSLPTDRFDPQQLYEKMYCARGDMENRIKEQQLYLFADRTSSSYFRSNQLRLWFSSVAYMLIHELRRVGLAGTQLANAQAHTIRNRLLKIGVSFKRSVRRLYFAFSSTFPLQTLFRRALIRIRLAHPPPRTEKRP